MNLYADEPLTEPLPVPDGPTFGELFTCKSCGGPCIGIEIGDRFNYHAWMACLINPDHKVLTHDIHSCGC